MDSENGEMVELALGRIVIQDGTDRQHIFLREREGERGFPILIGSNEALEIHRVVHGESTRRPLTHQLTFEAISALGATLKRVDIIELRENTFFAQLVLHTEGRESTAVVDARPSDAIALALRARCPIRVSERVLGEVSEQ